MSAQRTPVTIWQVDWPFYGKKPPRLVSAVGEQTQKMVYLSARVDGFPWRRQFDLRDVHLTPEAAIAAHRERLQRERDYGYAQALAAERQLVELSKIASTG